MSTSSAIRHAEQDQDPFRYGWHQVTVHRPDGSVDIEYQPLGPDAFVDPQPGDVVIQGSLHFRCVNALYDRLELYFDDDPTTAVFSDLKMLWGIPGLKEPCPDIAVVPGIRDKDAPRESFDVAAEGSRPCLVIEVLSRNYADEDARRKPPIYVRAGVPEYLLVKPYGKGMQREFSLWGHRLVDGRRRAWRPAADGYWHSSTVDLRFGVTPDRQDLSIIDTRTGEPLPTPAELEAASRRAAALAASERARADAERERADTERKRADTEARVRATAEDRTRELERRLAQLEAQLEAGQRRRQEQD